MYYGIVEYEWSSYFLIWAATKKTTDCQHSGKAISQGWQIQQKSPETSDYSSGCPNQEIG
jgi:hypothetical protein